MNEKREKASEGKGSDSMTTPEIVEVLLEKPYWIIDFLPEQVPEKSPGQFFAVEEWILNDPNLRRKQAGFLLKLNCYYDLTIVREDDTLCTNPKPRELASLIGREYLNILVGRDALISADRTDAGMTLYNPDEKLVELAGKLAASEGLFLRKGSN